MADRKSVQTEGYQLELEHLTQEKKLMQQLLQLMLHLQHLQAYLQQQALLL